MGDRQIFLSRKQIFVDFIFKSHLGQTEKNIYEREQKIKVK